MNTVINSGFIFYINQIIHIFGIVIQRIEDRKGNWVKLRFIKTKFRGYKNLTNYIKNNIEEISSAFDVENKSK